MPVFRIAGLAAALAGLFAGCATARSDLSAPAELTELDEAPIVVARGEKILPIVTDDTAANRWAALFLAQTIEETCGRRPRVYVVQAGQEESFKEGLFVGVTRSVDRADGDGRGEVSRPPRKEGGAFRVVAKDGSVLFSGRADYAVFDWCERYLGMRYYCAGGKCVERRAEIVVPSVDYSDAPVSGKRILSGSETWARVAKAGSEHRGGVSVHAPQEWYLDPELRSAHPAIFETGRTPMLCYGNPATLECYKARLERQIEGYGDSGGIVNTNRKVVTVCQWDAPVRCTCAWCRSILGRPADAKESASPLLWGSFLPRLASWMKERHPDYLISFLPYLNTVEPVGEETGLAALGNCEAEVCTMPGLALLKDESVREREEAILRGWQRATGRKVLNWNYGCWPLEYTSAPYVFGRTAQRHCAAMADTVAGTFICGGGGDPRIALSLYVWMKCLWNPEIDVEAVYDGFARRMFGPAAGPMRDLIALQERCWEREWDSTACTYRNVCEISYPPHDVARMNELLADARRLAADDATGAARVKWYAGGFDRFFREQEAAARTLAEGETVVRVGDVREMVPARNVGSEVWAKTTVEVRPGREKGILDVTVRCEDPAAATMDFTRIDDDFVAGDDSVTFVFEDLGKARVFKDGSCEGAFLAATSVSHDQAGWTVTASVKLPPTATHAIRGNVSRWRVGDRRQPQERRVPGSRYEHSRLKTVFTAPDTDPTAFVTFAF